VSLFNAGQFACKDIAVISVPGGRLCKKLPIRYLRSRIEIDSDPEWSDCVKFNVSVLMTILDKFNHARNDTVI
jgi:hypothetical protein